MPKALGQQMYDYTKMDPTKVLAQVLGKKTTKNLKRLNFSEVSKSRGESANIIDCGNFYLAQVIEGLGTKNLIADEMEKLTGKTFYEAIAQDTVAMIVNDLLTVGATPISVPAYFGLGSDTWLSRNPTRIKALITGWAKACDLSMASYPCGETPVLSGIINKDTIDLAGCATGIIKPKSRLVLQDKIKALDAIVIIQSSGVQSNGISDIRANISKLKNGYLTKMRNGKTFGEALLTPTHIYAKLNEELYKNKVDIHYIVNITGHGWRKLMRPNKSFTYEINKIPVPQEEFSLIQKISSKTTKEMYGTYNMGAGFAYYVSAKDSLKFGKICKKLKLKSVIAGTIQKGPKQVIIKPLNITFDSTSLNLR